MNVTLSNYRGKPVILNFWDSDCEPCYRHIPYLLEVYEERAEAGLQFLTVSRENEASLKGFMQQEGYFFVVALDDINLSSKKVAYHVLSFRILKSIFRS